MRTLVFDLETNGLHKRKNLKVHCGVVQDADTGEVQRYGPLSLTNLVASLGTADRLVGHNISGFDIPVLERCLDFKLRVGVELYDTFLASRMIYASNMLGHSIKIQRGRVRAAVMDKRDRAEIAEEVFPSKLLNRHSLESWGYRLSKLKGTHLKKAKGGADEEWSIELEDYCARDVALTATLYQHLLKQPAKPGWGVCSTSSVLTESMFGYIIGRQERGGVGFNVAAAGQLFGTLEERRVILADKLAKLFPPWIASDGPIFTPKINRLMKPTKKWPHEVLYLKGIPIQRHKMVTFKPGSGQHIANRLVELYGWKPTSFTDDGQPCTDEKTLKPLDYEGIPELCEYQIVAKRIGQLATGKKAWLKFVTPEGKIHGRVKVSGTRTLRCSHTDPNLGNVPKVGSPYGEECRGLFHPPTLGRVFVGIDASGIELRMLASRMAFYDDGAFWLVLSEGDPHTDWMKSTGIYIRNNQKTWTYATLYGAGDEKLGTIIIVDWRQALEKGLTTKPVPKGAGGSGDIEKELGKASRAGLLSNLPALDFLLKACKTAQKNGWLRGIDGAVIQCKTEHGSLNDLLQHDAVRIMKYAKVLLYRELVETDLLGQNCEFVLDIHDEWQIESDPLYAENIGKAGCALIKQAGEELGCRVPLDGEFKIGKNWRETH